VPATLFLALAALLIAVPTAIILGALAASRPRSLVDRVVNVITLAGASMVDFWLALILILVFAVHLQVLPTSGYGDLRFVLLPAITLAMRPLGRIAQITRSAMLEELAKPYVVMGRAKGLTDRRIILGHCLRNALIPITTLGSDEFLSLMNGAIVVEIIFAWPGVGSLLVQAIQRRDLPLVEATVFVIAVIVIATNGFVDIAYRRINPIIRTGRTIG
jgi:peptide/nickel transport system permease protein